MKVKKLIELLERCNPDAEVEAYGPTDPCGGLLRRGGDKPSAPVTGIAYSDAYVTLWTDEL